VANIGKLGIVHNVAVVGNDDKTRKLYLNVKKNTGAHSFFICKRRKTFQEVECVNINDILSGDITGLKIDTEGNEVEILNAIIDWMNIRKVVFEYHFSILKGSEPYFQLVELLKKQGFKVFYKEDPKGAWTTMVHAQR
jgi:bifunctional ADP-heptose synthase (sugar kinase/adenylyltransferase)